MCEMQNESAEAMKRAAEREFAKKLRNENSELQKKLSELRTLLAERESMQYSDIEVRGGTVVFL